MQTKGFLSCWGALYRIYITSQPLFKKQAVDIRTNILTFRCFCHYLDVFKKIL